MCVTTVASPSLVKERQERSNSRDGDEKVGRGGMGPKALTAEFNAKLIKSQPSFLRGKEQRGQFRALGVSRCFSLFSLLKLDASCVSPLDSWTFPTMLQYR